LKAVSYALYSSQVNLLQSTFAFCQVSTFVVTTKLDFSTQFLVRGLYQKDLAVPQGLETVPATGSIGAFPQPK
jgi:hypothetical protein